VMGRSTTIYPTLLWDEGAEGAVTLVDTGYPGQLPLIRAALEQAGFSLERLTGIIVTHQDIDHIGNLPAILGEASHTIAVAASEADRPYIQGDKMLIKITPEVIARAVASLPASMPEEDKQRIQWGLAHPPKAPVDTILADGETLPWGGGVTVIHTPGHTPGHLCLYHPRSRTLMAADALTVVDGRLSRPVPSVDADRALAGRSLRTLTAYDIETVVCYHGGLYRDDVNQSIAALAAEADA
jgi:glyoxylase-like metal-dependent hydrolase (beta-lactamase superfamily II)